MIISWGLRNSDLSGLNQICLLFVYKDKCLTLPGCPGGDVSR